MLKVFVKYPCERTRKMVGDLFLLDMCNRWSEYRLINDYIDMYQSPAKEEQEEKRERREKNREKSEHWREKREKIREKREDKRKNRRGDTIR